MKVFVESLSDYDLTYLDIFEHLEIGEVLKNIEIPDYTYDIVEQIFLFPSFDWRKEIYSTKLYKKVYDKLYLKYGPSKRLSSVAHNYCTIVYELIEKKLIENLGVRPNSITTRVSLSGDEQKLFVSVHDGSINQLYENLRHDKVKNFSSVRCDDRRCG